MLSRLAHSAESLEISLQHALAQVEQPSQNSVENLHQRVSQEIRKLTSNGCDKEQQRALSFLRNLPINRDCLRLERASASEHSCSALESCNPAPELRQWETRNKLYHPSDQEKENPQYLRNHGQFASPQCRPPNKPKRCVLGRLLIHKLPIGVLSVRVSESVTRQKQPTKGRKDWSYAIEFSLYPHTWLASRVITLSMTASSTFGDATSFSWNLKQAHYNSSQQLSSYLQNADIPGLQRLFMEGDARPTDLLAPWGYSLLHVSNPPFPPKPHREGTW